MKNSSIRVPYDWSGLTVGQLQEATSNLTDRVHVVSSMTKWKKENVEALPAKVVLSAYQKCKECLDRKPTMLHKAFFFQDTKHHFIRNWDELSTAEYVDLETYAEEPIKNAHFLLNILYRPEEGGQLILYDGPKGAEKFKKIPADVIGAAFLFFYQNGEKYKANFRRFLLKVEGAKAYQNIMGGTTHSTSAREKTQQK